MTHGRLVEWKVQEGEAFSEGDTLAEVETDKATMPIEAKDDGVIAKIYVQPDTADIPLGQLLAILVEEKGDVAAFANYVPEATSNESPSVPIVEAGSESPASSPSTTKPAPAQTQTSEKPAKVSRPYDGPISPAVARLLNEFPQIDLSRVAATGREGRILKGDVLEAIADGSAFGRDNATPSVQSTPSVEAAPASDAGYTDVPVTSMRRAIARRLTDSKQKIPHQYATIQFEMDTLLALRKRINSAEPSPKVSVNDFMIGAVAHALRKVPAMNMRWDDTAGDAVPNDDIDVAFAVALDDGLITPIVKKADTLGLATIASETKRMVKLAREGNLPPDEFEGGSFSTSNLGMFGISNFCAIINPPQSGNLAIASGTERVVLDDEDGAQPRVATVGTVTLSTDRRVVPEDVAGEFLQQFAACVANPDEMLL